MLSEKIIRRLIGKVKNLANTILTNYILLRINCNIQMMISDFNKKVMCLVHRTLE